jgi:uncharacterized lipoprotein YddW (UPF0748 family)
VWLTNSPSPLDYDAGRIERAVDELAEAGFNTLYPNAWSRGTTFHGSRWAPMEPALRQGNASLDPICRLTQAAHRRGLQVIPWFEYGLMEPADAEVVQQHPDWVLQKRDGTSLTTMHGRNDRVWLNPAHPGVRQRFIGLISEIVQRCGVDGIQLDDHFAWPVELGYDAYSRELYAKDTGLQPPDNNTDRAWMTWRRHRLSDLLGELRDSLEQVGKGRVYVSLSRGPFALPTTTGCRTGRSGPWAARSRSWWYRTTPIPCPALPRTSTSRPCSRPAPGASRWKLASWPASAAAPAPCRCCGTRCNW